MNTRALGALVLGLGVSLAACGGSPDATEPAAATPSPTTTAPGEMPTTVRVGQPFTDTYTNGGGPEMTAEVTVSKLECGIASIRTEGPPKVNRPEPGEEFCRAWYTIKNAGRRPLNWSAANSMLLMTDAGYLEQKQLDIEVTYALAPKADDPDPDPAFAGSELNPGKVGHSTQVWSVPAGTKASGLEFRHYPSTPPVIIKI